MRSSAIVIFFAALFLSFAAGAGPGNPGPSFSPGNSESSVCAVLRGATPSLRGLCEAYCAQRDQSGVDMNDIASVRAAAPDLKLLERYNARKGPDDPEMPCFAEPSESNLPPAGDEKPAPTSCACWSPEQIAVIDGLLDTVRGKSASVQCTLNDSDQGVYQAQVVEGYDLGTDSEIVVNSAFAYFELSDATTQGCMFQSPSTGIINYTLEDRAEGQYCIQNIVDQCATVNP